MNESEFDEQPESFTLEVANLYADFAIKNWLWTDLVGLWTRKHLDQGKSVDTWFRNLSGRIEEIKKADPSLPEAPESLSAIFFEKGISLLSVSLLRKVEYIIRATNMEVAERRKVAQDRVRNNLVWRKAFNYSRELPVTEAHWQLKVAISPYKQAGSVNSWAGELVNKYKYRLVTKIQRDEISSELVLGLSEFIDYQFSSTFVDRRTPPFDGCLGIPSNNSIRSSLPKEISRQLASRHTWLHDLNPCVMRTREIPSIKNLDAHDRKERVKDLYLLNPELAYRPKFGVLVFDDVYTTGATSDEMFRAVDLAYPGVPKYFIAFTHTRF